MSKKAMRLALEALENAQANFGNWWPEAIVSLREALASEAKEQPAQQEQGDSICQENDGCPTENAVLQRFWRGQSIPDEHYPAWFKPAQQEPVVCKHEWFRTGAMEDGECRCIKCGTWNTITPPQRKPLTHKQRVDLLAKFEAHKHEWHAPAILIDMVEAAHGIKENA